jgi:hypothetical protein
MIAVGKSRILVPVDYAQLFLHSKYWRLLVDDSTLDEEKEWPKHILTDFDIRGYDDCDFVVGWLVVNGIITLPPKPFQNIYCDYLMMEGYVPLTPEEEKKREPVTVKELQDLVAEANVRAEAETKRKKILAEEEAEVKVQEILHELRKQLQKAIEKAQDVARVEYCIDDTITSELRQKCIANGLKVRDKKQKKMYSTVTYSTVIYLEVNDEKKCIIM